ncbi:MAG: PEGA domain-containing protein, partial [Myxococcaceae bacterium]
PSGALAVVTDAGVEDAGAPEADAGGPDAVADAGLSPLPPDAGSIRKPPPKTRPPLAKGRVEFRIRPYATVFLDGKSLGQTPFGAVETTVGSHRVRIVNGDLKKDVTRTFEVKAGQDNVFKLNLLAE